MKKLISILLASLMLFCSMCVVSAETPSLDFFVESAMSDSIEQNATMNFKLNQPFLLLNELSKDDLKEISNYVNVEDIFETLFDSTIDVNAKVKAEKDKREFEAHIKSDTPFKINDNLNGDVKSKYDFWGKIDLSNNANPYFDIIMTHPFAAKYITVDSELMKENGAETDEALVEINRAAFDSEQISELNKKNVASMKKNASVTKKSNKVKIQFTDVGLKLYIADVIKYTFEFMGEEMFSESEIEELKKVMGEVPFFADEALVIEYTLDSKGRIATEKMVLNVKVNLYDLSVAASSEIPGATKGNSTLDFTVTAQTKFKYDNITINGPELTEENSVDIFEYIDPYYYYDEPSEDWYYEEDYYSVWTSAMYDSNCVENNEVKYVQLRSFLEGMGYYVYYDNGCIRAEINCEGPKYKAYCFGVGADVVYTDIHDVQMIKPVFMKDGVTYISIEDCENLTNQKKSSISYYYNEGYGYMEFSDDIYWLEY